MTVRYLRNNFLELRMIILLFIIRVSLHSAERLQEQVPEEFCPYETFQPQCLSNEVIYMRNATYGRMRIGRCITAAEIETLRSAYIGCSADVLPLLDRKCSGKSECEFRVFDISSTNINPCPPGLNVYLEASYDCIAIVDDRRSCAVDVTTNPIHLVSSASCGTKSQPWIIEAPTGQKLKIDVLASVEDQSKESCQNRGIIVDKGGKRNASICVGGAHREKELFLSFGHSLQIFINSYHLLEPTGNKYQFILRLQAVGCLDIIPPADGYSKRHGNAIMIGCYASRKTWHLNCEGNKWIGVIGNCSQGDTVIDSIEEFNPKVTFLGNEQVIAIVALGGFAVAVCLTIICLGVICLRRVHSAGQANKDYKTLNYSIDPTRNKTSCQWTSQGTGNSLPGNEMFDAERPQIPTYSVFVGDDFTDVRNSVRDPGNTAPFG